MSTTEKPTLEELRQFDLFEGIADTELQRFADVATMHTAATGDRVSEFGESARGLTLLLEGRLEMFVPEGDIETPQGPQIAPTWIGAIPVLLDSPNPVSMRAATDVRYALIPPADFLDLTLANREVFRHAMAQMKPVLGRIARRHQDRERLESLGTMAAGLAHELNNPAAAARRTAAELAESLGVLSHAIGVFVESGIEREHAGRLVALQTSALERCAARTAVSALDAADLEDDLSDALSKVGVPEPWLMSAPLAAAGIDPGFIQNVADEAGAITVPVLRWITASLSARQLAAELAESTDQMSKLVKAIKTYAYMDRGDIVQVDLREGLETTLTILGHKLKHTSIEVVRDYDPSLGPVMVRAAELNQVWTNLLDNAIDALGDSGTITLTTRADGACAEVDIADDGPGIPAEIRDKVFDPFFTTKDVGHGTGLGLAAARRIIADHHGGSLTIESRPGRTVFRARLPIKPPNRALTSSDEGPEDLPQADPMLTP